MSSNADLCARCGYARRVHIRSGFSGGSLHCPTMTFVEPSTLSPTSRTLCVDGEGVARIQDYPQPSTPSPDAGAPGAEGRLLCPVCGEHWNYNPNRPGAEAMAYNAYAMHSIGHRMAAQPPQRPGAQPEAAERKETA